MHGSATKRGAHQAFVGAHALLTLAPLGAARILPFAQKVHSNLCRGFIRTLETILSILNEVQSANCKELVTLKGTRVHQVLV